MKDDKDIHAGNSTPVEDEVLEKRARLLAQSNRNEGDDEDGALLQILCIGEERYGVELPYIWEVFPYQQITPLPGVPDMVKGVFNFRGEVVPLYDLMTVITGNTPERSPTGACVVLGLERVDLGVAVDKVEPPIKVDLNHLRQSVSRPGEHGHAYVRGFTDSGAVVINMEALLNDESLVIDS